MEISQRNTTCSLASRLSFQAKDMHSHSDPQGTARCGPALRGIEVCSSRKAGPYWPLHISCVRRAGPARGLDMAPAHDHQLQVVRAGRHRSPNPQQCSLHVLERDTGEQAAVRESAIPTVLLRFPLLKLALSLSSTRTRMVSR